MNELTVYEANERYEQAGEEFPCNDGRVNEDDSEVEVIKAEDVEVIEPPRKKMQSDRIDMLRKKQKEALSHIEDLRKFAEKADLIGIRSELQMMQMILSDWQKLQNEG